GQPRAGKWHLHLSAVVEGSVLEGRRAAAGRLLEGADVVERRVRIGSGHPEEAGVVLSVERAPGLVGKRAAEGADQVTGARPGGGTGVDQGVAVVEVLVGAAAEADPSVGHQLAAAAQTTGRPGQRTVVADRAAAPQC